MLTQDFRGQTELGIISEAAAWGTQCRIRALRTSPVRSTRPASDLSQRARSNNLLACRSSCSEPTRVRIEVEGVGRTAAVVEGILR
jgi:hypothetical protein